MKHRRQHRTILRASTVVVAAMLAFSACETSPPVPDRTFTRAGLLVDAVEARLDSDRPIQAVNTVTQGRDRGFLDDQETRTFLERVIQDERDRYRAAVADRDYRTAVAAEHNLRRLGGDPLELGLAVDATDGIASRDQLLLDWSLAELDAGEPVLALYLLLRRSTLGDLDSAQVARFLDVAGTLNHDEAVRRLSRIAANGSDAATSGGGGTAVVDSAAEMLRGTVTVWVNRGIRLEQGVGVPDRVIGSGFFVDPRGYLLTNYHVISSEVDPEYEGYSRLFVKLPGRPDQRIPARVVGYDRIFDLALLKVEVDPEYVFSLSDTRELEPGERVLALGSPGGLDSTVTSGIVSASGRRFLQMGEAVQVDVPINPGNSGGPLVLPDGQVAGVVFAGLEQFEGVNFAIPSYWIRHFFPRLFEDGEVTHAWIGISVFEADHGLQVAYVAPGSPADRAGIQAGMVLTEIEGTAVDTLAGAQDVLLGVASDSVLSTVWRRTAADGSVHTTRRLLATDQRPYSPVEDALERQPIEALFPVLYGMDVDRVSAAPWGPDFVITGVQPGSIADESSLSVDDPFALRDWRVDRDLRAAFIQIVIKKRKAGFLESGVQLGAFLETDSFL